MLIKNIPTIVIILLFIMAIFTPITFGYHKIISGSVEQFSTTLKDNMSEIDATIYENSSSIHVNLSGPRFWYVIKTYFSNQSSVTLEYYDYITSKNKTVNARATFFCIIPYKEGGYGYSLRLPNAYCTWNDFYIQLKFRRLNWGFYKINQDGDCALSKGKGKATISKLKGTYYFIFAAYAAECYYDFWFNTSEETIFKITQGNETFFYQREDFIGSINTGWQKGFFILNGKKEINVKNNLFAWFWPHGTTGVEFLNYRTPSGNFEWQFQTHKSFEVQSEKGSENFDKHLFNGEGGKWIFKTTIFNFDLFACDPNILLFGADIRLPD